MIRYCRTILLASAVFGVGMPALPADLSSLPPPADRKIDFMADVDPIFVQHCYMCHGDEAVMNGYSLWRRKSAVRGGYSGEPAIETRDSANSRLIHLVAGLEENLLMPPTGGKLSDEQIGILRAWIDQGVPFASTRFNDSTRAQDQPWLHMDYGPVISASVTVREPDDPRADKEPGTNVSYKSHAVMLGEGRRAGVIFDTELLRMAAGWNGPQYVLTGTVYDWKHGPHPHLDGEPVFETPVAPGWARDETFSDPRPERFGPLPADWAKYKGRYMFGDKVVLHYSVGGTDVLEMPGMQSTGEWMRCRGHSRSGPRARSCCWKWRRPRAPRPASCPCGGSPAGRAPQWTTWSISEGSADPLSAWRGSPRRPGGSGRARRGAPPNSQVRGSAAIHGVLRKPAC